MFTSWQTLHHAYRTAMHLGTSCISSLLYDPYLASCSSYVFTMTCFCPIHMSLGAGHPILFPFRGLADMPVPSHLCCPLTFAWTCLFSGSHLVCVTLALLRPYIVCHTRGSNSRTPNLTMITVTTNCYTPYPMQHHRSRLSHSPMAVHLMFTSCLDPSPCILHSLTSRHLMYFISALWPLFHLMLTSCSSHVLLMTRTRPIGYDPLI